jgi:hypothetical protein
MLKAQVRHWHLLRLFVAGGPPPALVTSPNTSGRIPPVMASHSGRFLDKRLNAGRAIVDRQDFIGRRRPLQRFIRALRGHDHPAGVVIFGVGGIGKSSLACRILDRLGEMFDDVVHVGMLDEPGLLTSLEAIHDIDAAQQSALQSVNVPLKFRLRKFLDLRAKAGLRPMLLVLDDFEQNLPLVDNQPRITVTSQAVMEAIVWAIEGSPANRCLVTSRYALTTTQGARFYQEQLVAMGRAEQEKKLIQLERYRGGVETLNPHLDRMADGNPRLMEQLDLALKDESHDPGALTPKLETIEIDFREQLLAANLAAGLPEPTRRLLAGLLVYEQPVPIEAIIPLFPDRAAGDLQAALAAASVVGLVEIDPQPAGHHYRVPRLLGPVLKPDLSPLVEAAASTLLDLWWKSAHTITEPESLEIIRLGRLAGRADLVNPVIAELGRE